MVVTPQVIVKVVNEYDYDAYGRAEIISESVPQPFLYTGREYEPEGEHYHYRARDYDPATGRFLQEDPIWFAAGDLNVHRYVWNNPLNWTDPSGLTAAAEDGATRGQSARQGASIGAIGLRLICLFDRASSAVSAASDIANGSINGDTILDLATTVTSCGVKVNAKPKKRGKPASCSRKKGSAGEAGFLSFPAGTPIITQDGSVAIEDLTIGDLVLSRDEDTGEMVFAPIADVFSRMTDEMSVVRLQTEDGVTALRLTPEHPAYVDGKGWVPAGALVAGDEILDYDGNTPLTVISVSRENTTERVYNFEVDGTHTYFAGDVGAWVHNGRGSAFKALFNHKNTSRAHKGWIQQELNRGRTFSNVRTPPACDLGHPLGKPKNKGNRHGPDSRFETPRDNRRRGAKHKL